MSHTHRVLHSIESHCVACISLGCTAWYHVLLHDIRSQHVTFNGIPLHAIKMCKHLPHGCVHVLYVYGQLYVYALRVTVCMSYHMHVCSMVYRSMSCHVMSYHGSYHVM